MSKREALVAVLIAFAAGVLGAGSLRDLGPDESRPAQNRRDGAVESIRDVEGPILRWRVTSAFGTHLPTLGENPVQVADRLRTASRGRIDWTIDDPGEVVPAFAIVDAVRTGKIKAGYTWLGYDQGRLAVSVLFGAVPFGMTPWEYSAWWVREAASNSRVRSTDHSTSNRFYADSSDRKPPAGFALKSSAERISKA